MEFDQKFFSRPMKYFPNKVIFLSHSKILFIPLIGTLYYLIQDYLFKKGLIYNIRISRRNNPAREKLLKTISQNSKYVICRSYKFGRLLSKVKSEIILDVSIDTVSCLRTKELYGLMWTLVFVSSITSRTKESLKNLFPENFPVKKIIVIPFNDSFDVVCDYISQTARVLANEGNIVYLVALAKPISALRFLSLRRPEKSKRQKFFDKNGIIVTYPVTLFPLRFMKSKIVETINKRLSLIYTSLFIKSIKADYLWCFDPVDFELVKIVNKQTITIYDCVDFISTLDPLVDKQIKKNERKLIKAVDYFFVNSHSLSKTKGKIRKPDTVVPQGFDLSAFTTKEPLAKQERREIENFRKILRKITKPRVGFIGNLTFRLDFKLLLSLIRRMPKVSFVFTDAFLPFPHDDRFVETQKLIEKIRSAQNAYFIPKTFSRRVIKEMLRNYSVGIIPYDINFDFNRFCYPMKLFEYFYLGLPVVSTPIEELRRFPKFVKIGKNASEWENYLATLSSKPWPRKNKFLQKKLAKENCWENKVKKIIQTIEPQFP